MGNIAGIVLEPRETYIKALWKLSRKRSNVTVICDWETQNLNANIRTDMRCGEEVQAKRSKGNEPFCFQVTDIRPPWWSRPKFSSVGLSFLFCNMKCLD